MIALSAASVLAGCLASCSSGSATSQSSATSAADIAKFYAGKTITLVVPSAPGGGIDSTSRVFAANLGNYIPGHPKFVVQDVPAGGGSVAMTDVSRVYPANGLYVAVTSTPEITRKIFNEPGSSNYDMTSMKYIGVVAGSAPTVVRTAAGADLTTLRALKKPLVCAAPSPGAFSTLTITLGMHVLGVPYKIVYGYSGSGPIAVAIQQGAVDCEGVGYSGYLKTFKPLGSMTYPIYQIGYPAPDGGVVADTNETGIPSIEDVYKTATGAQSVSGEYWQAINWVAETNAISTGLMVRHDTPPAAVAALTQGFAKMIASPAFKSTAIKLLGEPVTGPTPAQAQSILAKTLNVSPSLAAFIKKEANA